MVREAGFDYPKKAWVIYLFTTICPTHSLSEQPQTLPCLSEETLKKSLNQEI
jgi:hypothetical protein